VVGGTGPKALDRVLEFGDIWMPNARIDLGELPGRVTELRERAGRRFPVTYFGAEPTDEFVETLVAAGVDRILLQLPPGPADEVLPLVAQYAELAARHR
jgi:hypothetical protein